MADYQSQNEQIETVKAELLNIIAVSYATLGRLQNINKSGLGSRERSIAITELQTSILYLEHDLKTNF